MTCWMLAQESRMLFEKFSQSGELIRRLQLENERIFNQLKQIGYLE